jgi:Flp pilus assembly protein TadB
VITVLAVTAALGGALVAAGLYRAWAEHVSALAAAVRGPSFVRQLADRGRMRPRGGARGQVRLPRPLRYLEGRMRAAGVDWEVPSIVGLIAGTGLATALLAYTVTGILWVTVLALGVGFYAPVWRLNAAAQKRAALVMRQLDQVCTELIQAVSAGLDLFRALRDQAVRAPDPTGAELRRVVARVQEGEPLVDVVRELGERIDLEEAQLFAVGVRMAQEEGAHPGPVLESVLRSLRSRRELAGLIAELSSRERKQSLILVAVPLVLMPGMRLVSPQMTWPLFHTFGGQVLVVADILWMMFGLRLVQGWFGGVRA